MTIVLVLLAGLALLLAVTWLAPGPSTRLGLWGERSFSGLGLHHAVVDGIDLPYLEGGSGPVLLLVHGFGGDKDNFTRVARFLTPHYRVIIPDLPGFGDSTRDPAISYSIADQVARMHRFVTHLGIGHLHVGGNSMGGFIAAQFAAIYPGQVESVWLLDPLGAAASHETAILRQYEATGDMPLLLADASKFDIVIAATTHKAPFLPGFVRKELGRRAAADFALHTQIMRALQDGKAIEELFQPMATPAMIVWGAQDQLLAPAGAETFRTLFPRSQVRIMDGIGHLPMAEAPKQVAEEYLAFRRTLQGD